MPHKEAVLAFIASLDEGAKYADAANTIVAEKGGSTKGYNTDILAVASLVSALPRSGYPNHVATYFQIIGAGGAGRAAALGVLRAGRIDLEFYNRSAERAQALAARVGYTSDDGYGLDCLGPTQELGSGSEDQRYSNVVINASSMGMQGYPEVPIDLAEYYPDTIIFDMVYHPLETGLLRQARALGMRTVDGLQMLVAQAAHAFELFFGAKAPREHDDELRELLTR
jgi:shikimate dehydrogenase